MKFSIVVYSDAAGNGSAQAFCRAVLERGHEVYRVFFFGDGVQVAASNAPDSGWDQLAAEYPLERVTCVTAAVKRGLLAEGALADTRGIKAGFAVGGLGQLTDAALQSDRVVTFR